MLKSFFYRKLFLRGGLSLKPDRLLGKNVLGELEESAKKNPVEPDFYVVV